MPEPTTTTKPSILELRNGLREERELLQGSLEKPPPTVPTFIDLALHLMQAGDWALKHSTSAVKDGLGDLEQGSVALVHQPVSAEQWVPRYVNRTTKTQIVTVPWAHEGDSLPERKFKRSDGSGIDMTAALARLRGTLHPFNEDTYGQAIEAWRCAVTNTLLTYITEEAWRLVRLLQRTAPVSDDRSVVGFKANLALAHQLEQIIDLQLKVRGESK